MILIFFLFTNLLFSRNVAVLLGDFKTKDGSYMNKIATMLRNRGFEVIDDIQVDTSKSVSSQSDVTIKTLIRSCNITQKDNLILIGHSQGGLRAVKLYRSCEFLLNIRAIFNILAPWQGVSILNKRHKIINEIVNTFDNLDKCKEYISEIGSYINLSNVTKCIKSLEKIKIMIQDNIDCLGIKDILPGSQFINELDKHISAPIFNVISYSDKYEPNMNNINNYKQQIDKLAEYAKKLSVINNVLLMDKTLTSNKLTTDASKQVIYASKLVDNLISLLNELIEFNKEDNNGVLTVKEQQLPNELNQAQCKLRNKEGTLGYVVKGVHRSFTDEHEGTVYDNDEVVNYISRSIDNNFHPVLKDEDVK